MHFIGIFLRHLLSYIGAYHEHAHFDVARALRNGECGGHIVRAALVKPVRRHRGARHCRILDATAAVSVKEEGLGESKEAAQKASSRGIVAVRVVVEIQRQLYERIEHYKVVIEERKEHHSRCHCKGNE